MQLDQLEAFLHHRAGDQFWGLVYYTPKKVDVLYTNDRILDDEISTCTERIISRNSQMQPDADTRTSIFKNHQADILYFQDSIVIHIPFEEKGLVAVFDVTVAPDSQTFIQKCLDIIQKE